MLTKAVAQASCPWLEKTGKTPVLPQSLINKAELRMISPPRAKPGSENLLDLSSHEQRDWQPKQSNHVATPRWVVRSCRLCR